MKAPSVKVSLPAIDFQAILADFKTLDPKDPGMWPLGPRLVILTAIFLAAIGAAWWFGWSGQLAELDAKVQQENKLKDEWLNKKKQAINLDEYKSQLAEIDRSFGALLKQLPNASEMDSLLVDINQAGLGRGLQFELFKPGKETVRDFYAELPITIKVTAPYHDLGAFAGDIAKMPRIVTLNDIEMTPVGKDGTMSMSAVAKTFRYLGEDELAKQRRSAAAKKAAGGN